MTEFQNGNQNGALSTRLMGIWRSVSVPITAIVLALVRRPALPTPSAA